MSQQTDYSLLLTLCVGTLVKDITMFDEDKEAQEGASKLCELISSVKDKEARTSMTLRELSEDDRETLTIEMANMLGISLSELSPEDLEDFNHFIDLIIRATASLSGAAAFLGSIRS